MNGFFQPGKPLRNSVEGGGFYLEMGALDGIVESNSLFYDRCLGWRGLLIEANPVSYKKLVDNGQRPSAHKLNVAPSCMDDHSTIRFNAIADSSAAEYDTLSDEEKKRAESHVVDVHCGPMSTYLRELGIKKIDFWSLDVEGAEFEVLKTFDFDSTKVGVLMVESLNRQCGADCPKREAVRELLKSKGATLIKNLTPKSDVFIWE